MPVERLKYLIVREISGTISNAECEELGVLKKSHPGAYQQIYSAAEPDCLLNRQGDLPAVERLKALIKRIRRP